MWWQGAGRWEREDVLKEEVMWNIKDAFVAVEKAVTKYLHAFQDKRRKKMLTYLGDSTSVKLLI